MTTLTPLSALRVISHQIAAHGPMIPNTSFHNKPLLIYKGAFPSDVTTSQIEGHLNSIGVVEAHWRYTMYSFDHFHSTSHEVLGISRGRARLCFGHLENPERVEEELERGDVVVVPAGLSHRLIEDLKVEGEGFEMVGCYPKGCSWDMCYGKKEEQRQLEGMKSLPWFTKDPVYGDQGPVLNV